MPKTKKAVTLTTVEIEKLETLVERLEGRIESLTTQRKGLNAQINAQIRRNNEAVTVLRDILKRT